jgi:hypothetical protein
MAHALNLFVPIRQDPDSLKLLAEIKENFATKDQAEIEKAARESEIIHFLRVLILDDKYFVVLTEYDGGHEEYAEFFRQKLPDLFKQIFTLANGRPPHFEGNPLAIEIVEKIVGARPACGCHRNVTNKNIKNKVALATI